MKQIPLTKGQIALVDDEDFEYLNQFKWCAVKARDTYYAIRSGYDKGRKPQIKMHRFISELADSNILCDHKDGNGLNNQKHNLRVSNKSQNGMNRGPQKNGTSKYKGVSWFAKANKWMAKITINKKQMYIGCFNDIEDAAKAYDEKAKEIFGEFAWLNFK
jgi:hypothetical protein